MSEDREPFLMTPQGLRADHSSYSQGERGSSAG